MLLGRPSSTRGAYAAATWAVNESLRRTLIGCSGSCSVGSRRRDRGEDCCLLHAMLAVLDRVRSYIRGCWRKSPRAKCRLSGQTPRTKGASERRKARGEEGDGETKKEVVGARSVATESTFSCDLEHHRRCRPSLPVPRAASGRRPYIPHEHRALDLLHDQVHAGRQLARSPALIPAWGQPRRPRKPRIC